ncbi:MAG TPA: hypothetical protein VHL79_02995 [Ramlibacter sp.]|jgi:hypothetical protein|nr:hypothetical protein [Ramlibacter sp.]
MLAAALLVACGGGDDDRSPALASGAWRGTSDTGRDVAGLVLHDGSYYLLYSVVGSAATPGGFVQGTGRFEGDEFVSTDLRDYNVEGVGTQAGTLVADVFPTTAFRARVATPRTPQSFDTQAATDFAPASLATLAGSYTGQVGFSLGFRPGTFTVTSAGAVSTNINGCDITGSTSPRAEGNVYDLTMTFGGAPCVFPNVTFTGIAYVRGNQLRAMLQEPSRRQGIVFAGTRN